MIDRYLLEKMKNIWSMDSKFDYYLRVELAVCNAYRQLGKIPQENYDEIVKNAKFDLKRIDEVEKEVHHDVIAFLTCVNESLGDNAKYMHMGLTSSDIIDTAYALQIKEASSIIADDLANLIVTIKQKANQYKNTVCIGRSHGIHAEVTTFGLKLLNWLDSFERAYKNFLIAADDIATGQISGPVGTYSNLPMEVEKIVCENLDLKSAKISTQIISRDVYARYMNELAMIATIIEQYSTEIRNLQRTEIFEVQEGFAAHQKGSSAMPHKRNPVLCENLCGLARVVRGYASTAMQNVALWHERDISHSSAERIIFPDSTALVDFMLVRFNNVLTNLVVYEENMRKNTNLYGGIVYSQKVLLKLTEKGLSREDAYEIVQKNALSAIDNNGNFKENLLADERVTEKLSNEEIEECFDVQDYLKNVNAIFAKF
ncbi:adenylosuccinate lyase [bacterium]|nr:adenylosuccinate lyase [bacterium]